MHPLHFIYLLDFCETWCGCHGIEGHPTFIHPSFPTENNMNNVVTPTPEAEVTLTSLNLDPRILSGNISFENVVFLLDNIFINCTTNVYQPHKTDT